jgi:hypothetical protein
MSISENDDEIEFEPMEISTDNCLDDDYSEEDICSDEEKTPVKGAARQRRVKILDICLNPQKMCSRPLPMRPVF